MKIGFESSVSSMSVDAWVQLGYGESSSHNDRFVNFLRVVLHIVVHG